MSILSVDPRLVARRNFDQAALYLDRELQLAFSQRLLTACERDFIKAVQDMRNLGILYDHDHD